MDTITKSAQTIEQYSIIVQPEAPWLQQNGKHTPDEFLKTLTPTWSPELWEKYLIWFENHSGTRAESLVGTKKYDRACESEEESLFSAFAQSNADDELKNIIGRFLLRLTPQQRRVIEMIFWEGRSERYVAQALGINQQPVNRLKKRALSKIKDLISEGVSSRIMSGENSPLINEGGTNAECLSLAKGHLAEAS
jgi:RNA polymerase sigma factor (sigma-70 family)